MKHNVNLDKGMKGKDETVKQKRTVDNKKAVLIIGVVVLLIALSFGIVLERNDRGILSLVSETQQEKLNEVNGIIEIYSKEDLKWLSDNFSKYNGYSR